MRAATAAAGPLEEPPGERSLSQGLRAGPKTEMWPVLPEPYSCMFATPTITAPASLSAR
jgi:hypothetical protein